MVWPNRSRKPETDSGTVVGLDLTATRVRAVYGPAIAAAPRVLLLDNVDPALPLTINMEYRNPEVGRSGRALIRRLPHLVCRDYLPTLGQAREWRVGRRRLDPAAAIALLVQRLQQPLSGQHAIAVALPSYLTVPQATLLTAAFANAKVPVIGTIAAPPAIVAANHDVFMTTALVAEADEHALTWSVLASDGEQARVLATLTQPAIGVRAWLDRLLDAVSHRCIRLCRRDPRDSGDAEQTLYEQIDAALDHLRPGVPVALSARTSQWYQELTLAPEEVEQFCVSLARQAVDGMRQALAQAHASVPAMAQPEVLWMTAEAARLPGLASALGQNLPESTAVRPLSANAVAEAAHALVGRWLDGRLPRGHVDAVVSLDRRLRRSDESSTAKPHASQLY